MKKADTAVFMSYEQCIAMMLPLDTNGSKVKYTLARGHLLIEF